MNEKRFGAFLSSSTDPSKLAATVQGAILAVSSIIVYVGMNFLGIEITQGDITSFAAAAAAVVGGVATLYGLLRKIVVTLAERK